MKLWQWFKREDPTFVADWLVIGLGNPGVKYRDTRHNVGYLVTDALLTEPFQQVKGMPVAVSQLDVTGIPVLLARSTTYMNLSGQAIAPLCAKLNIPADRVIIIHDELDLPLGTVRVKQGGNENGHNGLKSASAELGTRDYLRVRLGISRPPQGMSVPDYVLSPLEKSPVVDQMVATAVEAVKLIITGGLPHAQNQIHAR